MKETFKWILSNVKETLITVPFVIMTGWLIMLIFTGVCDINIINNAAEAPAFLAIRLAVGMLFWIFVHDIVDPICKYFKDKRKK